jgi:hypothetical protein
VIARSRFCLLLARVERRSCSIFCPGLFDGIEAGRTGRQTEHFRSPGLDRFAHPCDLVRTEVVHHHYAADCERGAQDLFDTAGEDTSAGSFLDGHRRTHCAEPHRRQNGHDLPVAAGRRFVDPATTRTASVGPRHRGCDTAFAQENQVFRRDRPDALDELFTPLAVGLGVAFRGVERLFLKRTPSRSSTFHTWAMHNRTPCRSATVLCNSARVRPGRSSIA